MGGLVLKEFDLDEGYVEQEARIDEHAWLTHINGSAIVLHECLRWAAVDIELNDLEDLTLHASHLICSKRVLCHLDEIGHDGRVDFLELARNEHGCDSEELELVEGNFLLA